MEVLWEKTDMVFRLINIIANSAIVSIFYATFLREKRKSAFIGVTYLAVMTILYLIPYEMPAAFAYAMGIISVLFVSVAAEKGNIPRKIFLSVTIYLLNWIAGGIVNIPWNAISRLTFMNPKFLMDQDLQYRFFVVAQVSYVLLENAIFLVEVKLVDRLYKNKRESMQWRELLLLISPCAAIMIGYWFSSFLMNAYERDTATYIWNTHKGSSYIRSVFQIFSFLAILSVIRAYQEIRQAHEETLQNVLIAREIEDLKSHVGSVEKYYKDVRAMKHDMNNHLVVVKRLIEQDNRKEAEKYIEAMYKKELRGMFNINGMQTFLKANGMEGAFAEPVAEYRIDDLGPKRVAEDKPKDSENTQEYKPLEKVEEIEEENYNQIDNYLNNTKPKAEEIREKRQEEVKKNKDKPSILARMREKKTIIEARKTERELHGCELKAERIV